VVNDKVYTSTFACVHDSLNKDLPLDKRKLVYEKAMAIQQLYNKVNGSIDTINHYQAMLKVDSVAYSKNKNAMAFYADLEKQKGELMGITKTSIFADEKRLREKVSELYSTFCYMESTPNQTQLESISDLQNDYAKISDDLKKVFVKHLPKNPELKKRIDN
jgi:hypothetical protein